MFHCVHVIHFVSCYNTKPPHSHHHIWECVRGVWMWLLGFWFRGDAGGAEVEGFFQTCWFCDFGLHSFRHSPLFLLLNYPSLSSLFKAATVPLLFWQNHLNLLCRCSLFQTFSPFLITLYHFSATALLFSGPVHSTGRVSVGTTAEAPIPLWWDPSSTAQALNHQPQPLVHPQPQKPVKAEIFATWQSCYDSQKWSRHKDENSPGEKAQMPMAEGVIWMPVHTCSAAFWQDPSCSGCTEDLLCSAFPLLGRSGWEPGDEIVSPRSCRAKLTVHGGTRLKFWIDFLHVKLVSYFNSSLQLPNQHQKDIKRTDLRPLCC